VLVVALVRQGIEPIHASVVEVEDCAIAFLGDCTFGKSTLLASFLQTGHRAVTDDMLLVDRRAGEPRAMAGSGRIKLLPDSAHAFLRGGAAGALLTPMTAKRAFSLDERSRTASSLPLRMLFLLPDPDERDRSTSVEIQPVSPAQMVCSLVQNTFTAHVVDRQRLARQFEAAAQLASEVDGFRLRYPTGLHHLPSIRREIVDHARARIGECVS
jgi:hypothetical protein